LYAFATYPYHNNILRNVGIGPPRRSQAMRQIWVRSTWFSMYPKCS